MNYTRAALGQVAVDLCRFWYNRVMSGVAKKDVEWLGSSRSDIAKFGDDVCDALGTDLLSVQYGVDPSSAKHLKDGLSEIKLDANDNTYRLMYVAKFDEAIYVLHVFIKKSNKGDETPKRHANIIKSRHAEALASHQKYLAHQKEAKK